MVKPPPSSSASKRPATRQKKQPAAGQRPPAAAAARPSEPTALPDEGQATGQDSTAALPDVSLPAAPFPQARRPHDPTGLDLAARIAQAARGGRPAPRRRRPGPETADETAWSGPGPSERDPRPVGQLLDRVIADQGWRRDLSVASLLGHWADFVGPANAAHTKPESFRNGELSVRAESTAWATAIRLLAPQIAARLNAALGGGVVERVKVLGPEMPNRPKGRRSVRGRGPRGDYG